MTSTARLERGICWLGELGDGELPLAGGKAGTLAKLYQAGYPVPHGFVILPAAFEGDELRSGVWARVRANLQQMRSSRAEGQASTFAVRSSASGEDSAGASFAGAFETVLGVDSDEAVRDAIHTVRHSRHAERVEAYRRAREGAATAPGRLAPLEMAVLVQRLVSAEFSGVLFTADPVTGSRAQMTGNYVPGLGDRLVSGKTRPLTFSLSRGWSGDATRAPPS